MLLTCNSVLSEVDIITEPKSGEEYVFIQASDAGARPIQRKEKSTDASDRPFETAHKLPAILTYRQQLDVNEGLAEVPKKFGKEKREAANAPAAAPPGSIKIDPLKLIERYRSELESSTKKSSGTTTKRTTTSRPSTTTRRPTRRQKKEATTESPVLTTGAPSTPRTLELGGIASAHDINTNLAASGTENKRSKIQIKKGPNGQEYEYEYVYYYYDDDDATADDKQVFLEISTLINFFLFALVLYRK